jgi:hypothetical protein
MGRLRHLTAQSAGWLPFVLRSGRLTANFHRSRREAPARGWPKRHQANTAGSRRRQIGCPKPVRRLPRSPIRPARQTLLER